MAHLAAGAGGALAVEMQTGGRVGNRLGPGLDRVADQVPHYRVGVALGRAERVRRVLQQIVERLAADALHRENSRQTTMFDFFSRK